MGTWISESCLCISALSENGANDPAWAGAKEGDIVMEFQVESDSKYKQNQFRHVTSIMKIVTVWEVKAQGLSLSDLTIIGGDKSKYSNWPNNHRLAITLGASEEYDKQTKQKILNKTGVGLRDKEWHFNQINNTEWTNLTRMLWHDMDGDWVENGISRQGRDKKTFAISTYTSHKYYYFVCFNHNHIDCDLIVWNVKL